MPSNYARVRRKWRDSEIERDLAALWASERFEDDAAVADALRLYELAIRVEGWGTVKRWARERLADGRILNAQLVELAMRALEQGDGEFLEEMTAHLLETSAPNFFRFWYTLFSTRHSHRGERIFRGQLAALADYRVIKYRRWLKRILRKLRFRCHTPREKAIGAIAFGMYEQYDANAYPSPVFDAYLACHDAARTPAQTKLAKPVPKVKQMQAFAEAAARLGIWTIAEGIRTSHGLPRTREYLAAMAPKLTDQELIRALRAFDANLVTADHKRASEEVVALAEYLHERLHAMDVPVEEWCKIYPYQQSPVLVRVFEELIGAGVDAALARLEPVAKACFVPIAPVPLEGRAYRAALLLAYLMYRNHDDAAAFLADAHAVRALSHPSALWPHGYGVEPPVWRWQPAPDRPHRALCDLVRETFPAAATRRVSIPLGVAPYVTALRYHLYRRAVVSDRAEPTDVPVLVFAAPPDADERQALLAHLEMFSAAVLVLIDQPWEQPLVPAPDASGQADATSPVADRFVHITLSTRVIEAADALAGLADRLAAARAGFMDRQPGVSAQIRHLRLGPMPRVTHVAQGPYRGDGGDYVAPPPASGGTAAGARASGAARSAGGSFSVVITSAGRQKIMAIKAIREITGWGLAESKAAVDAPPTRIAQNLSRADAEAAVRTLVAAGAAAVTR